ncbi:MAG: hypothetical protein ACRBEE_05000 [Arenicella sp.]
MSLSLYVVIYIFQSLFWKWILSWGGAKAIEGWKSIFFLEWFTAHWSAEHIRLFALCMWIAVSIGFVIGLFYPELRGVRY